MGRKKKQIEVTTPTELNVATRQGTLKNGGTFRLVVSMTSLTVNGEEVSGQVASEATADLITTLLGGEAKEANSGT